MEKEFITSKYMTIITWSVKIALIFIATWLLQVGWRMSFIPVFNFRDISYMEALGFVIVFRSLFGFPEIGRAYDRKLKRLYQLEHQAFMQGLFSRFLKHVDKDAE